MNYLKHYETLMTRAKSREISGPVESHHVVPTCMGGTNDQANLVDLTPEEHFVAHQLLVKMHPEHRGIVKAAAMMVTNRNSGRRSNKVYGWLRRRHYAARLGEKRSDAARAAISEGRKKSEKAKAATAKLHAAKIGVPRPKHVRDALSVANMGKRQSEHQKRRMSEVHTGRVISDEVRAKISAAAKGKRNALGAIRSPETRARMSASKTPEQRSAAALKTWETRQAKTAIAQLNQWKPSDE